MTITSKSKLTPQIIWTLVIDKLQPAPTNSKMTPKVTNIWLLHSLQTRKDNVADVLSRIQDSFSQNQDKNIAKNYI